MTGKDFDFTPEGRRRHAPEECAKCGEPRIRTGHASWCPRAEQETVRDA